MSTALAKETLDDLLLQAERSNLTKNNKLSKEGILHDVHLIGLIGKSNKMQGSKTPYKYTEESVKEAVSLKLYDNVDIYLGHNTSEGQRNPKDKIGYVVADSVKHKEGVGAVGNLQFNTAHPYYEAMMFWVEKQPEQIMMSHVADLSGSRESNEITKIKKVYSVDLVLNGNTTQGIHAEGVIADAITLDQTKDYLRNLVSKAESLFYRILYPITSYDSSGQNKVLTDPEKALLMAPIAKDLLNELKSFGEPKKENTMEYKDITLDEFKKNRPDLAKQLEAAAVAEEAKLTERVLESVKEVPADKRSDTFLTLVRESLRADNVAQVKALVDDRILICKESAVSAENIALAAKQTKVETKKQEAVELTDAAVIAAIKG